VQQYRQADNTTINCLLFKMTFSTIQTSILVQGVSLPTLEAFAEYVATEQDTGWLVKRAPYSSGDYGYFQLGFNSELCFRQVAAIQKGLKGMGASVALCLSSWD
jgi:hypothetical protein